MLTRNDQPVGYTLNFAVDNLFIESFATKANNSPILPNAFLLLDSPLDNFLLLDGTQLLLLGT